MKEASYVLISIVRGIRRTKGERNVFCLEWQDFKNIKNMGGGYAAWVEKGFTVEKPKVEL